MKIRKITQIIFSFATLFLFFALFFLIKPSIAQAVCSDNTSCSSCISEYPCGWNGYSCEDGSSSCPSGYSQWYWTSCSTNVCVATPPSCSNYNNCSDCISGAPYNCGWNGYSCQAGSSSCPSGYSTWYYTSCSSNVCSSPTQSCSTICSNAGYGRSVCAVGRDSFSSTYSECNPSTTCNYSFYKPTGDGDCSGSYPYCWCSQTVNAPFCNTTSCTSSGYVAPPIIVSFIANPSNSTVPGNTTVKYTVTTDKNIFATGWYTRIYDNLIQVRECYSGTTCDYITTANNTIKNVVAKVTNFRDISSTSQVITTTWTDAYPNRVCTSEWREDQCGSNNPCTLRVRNYDCSRIDYLCSINPFCTKYTGNECSTHSTESDPPTNLPPGSYCVGELLQMGSTNICGGNLAYWFNSTKICHDISVTPTPTPTPTTPTPTPTTPTPTPTPIIYLYGRHVNAAGNDLSSSTSPTNIGQVVTLTKDGSNYGTNSNSPFWTFPNLSPGTYTVTASSITGYTISHSTCTTNDCSHTVDSYIPGASASVPLLNDQDFADIYFKYTLITCSVATSTNPAPLNFVLGQPPTSGSFTVTGVTGLGGATIDQIDFKLAGGANDTIASINPTSGSTTLSSTTTVTPKNKIGSTDIWATVRLSNGNTCESPPRAINVTATTTPTPTGTPSCQVRTSPDSLTMPVGETRAVTATIENLPVGRTVSRMRFGAYNTSVATVNPTVDLIANPYSTAVTAVGYGSTAVWATADLDNGTFCQASGAMDTDIIIPTPTLTPTVSPTPCTTYTPPFSISGKVFDDKNGDTLVSLGEPNYTGTITITNNRNSTNYPVTKNADGTYISSGLSAAGEYTIAFSEPLTTGYWFTYPPLSLVDGKRSLAVTVGSCCSPIPGEGICSNGNISNLNAGVTNTALQWIQSQGSDLRWDSGFNNTLPPARTPTDKTNTSIPLPGGDTPGIIFSGNKLPNFGGGQASVKGWQVGSPNYPDLFTDTHSVIPTSYKFLLETANSSGITPANLLSYCGSGGIGNCTLSSSLPHGIYKADGDLTITNTANYSFPKYPSTACPTPQCNFIILVNGNLNINLGANAKIKVPVGSTAIFSAKGNITINRNVGAASPASGVSDIEGLYSADGNFYTTDANQISNCFTEAPAKRLNIAGSVIANAGRSGGTFVNKRTLCANNASYPSVSFIARPDFMLNYPSMVRQIPRTWQDIAP